MKKNRITQEEVGAMLEEAFEGEPFRRIEPPPRFSLFFRQGIEPESFFDKLKRFLVIPSVPRRLVFSGAVVAILLVVLIPMMPDSGQITYRGSGATEPEELPQGRVSDAPRALHWPAVDKAVSYRVELTDLNGEVIWGGRTGTNRIDLPAPLFVGRAVGSEYTIRVIGLDADGEEMSRQTSRFLILP